MDTQDPQDTPEENTTGSGQTSEDAALAASPETPAREANATDTADTTATSDAAQENNLAPTDHLVLRDAPGTGTPLTVGTVIGGFRVTGVAPDRPKGPAYFAEAVEDTPTPEEELPGVRHVIRELTGGAHDHLAHIVAMGIRHPALLAPVALAREQGRLFLISLEVADQEGNPVPPMSVGERLRAVDALRAGIELADALALMHRNGLAHLHISPELVTLYEGRIYLGGVEEATSVATDDDESQPLFARDANFLARTMGLIGGVVDTPALDEESSAQRSLREIALRGEAATFTKAEELAESFALTLQALAAAGAEMGADLRSVRLTVTADAASSVGLVRAANQDAYGIAVFNVHDDAAADAPVGVFLVADGMGGEAHGEIASRLVARVVTAELTRQFTIPVSVWPAQLALDAATAVDTAPRLSLAQALEAAVKEANRQTRVFGARLQATTGSTVTALAIAGARAAIAHLGDSRAYLLRDSQLLQLTEDHSLLAKMEAMQHPLLEDPSFLVPRSVLYRSVGQEDDVTPDLMEFVIAPGDRIMLCSDGLWDELAPEVIGQAMAAASSPRACAAELVALANAAGGADNSTAVVIFVEAEPEDAAMASRAEAHGGATDLPDATTPPDVGDLPDATAH
ncbi:MAG: protein phosphatase 2C domain-containing protein [Chloroflexota bacterium]|nr:protein phosphatase 2C domain-containing protein [Chloroflexota bacterium]